MFNIQQAKIDKDQTVIRELFGEYLEWANSRLNEEYNINFDIQSTIEQDMHKLDIFFPPNGRLLLARTEDQTIGIACMKKIRKEIGEIKRMYVRSEFREKGIGRALLEKLISEARMIGYPWIRLDSSRFMKAAHSLYRSAGFQEIDPYKESEIPPEYQHNWIFMEKKL